jgi:hypothetical protein
MEIEGAVDGRSGAVTVVQRTSADLKLNPHLHAVVLDGVFVAAPKPLLAAGQGRTAATAHPSLRLHPVARAHAPGAALARTKNEMRQRNVVRMKVIRLTFPG